MDAKENGRTSKEIPTNPPDTKTEAMGSPRVLGNGKASGGASQVVQEQPTKQSSRASDVHPVYPAGDAHEGEHDHDHGHHHHHCEGGIEPRQIAELVIAAILFIVGTVFRTPLHNASELAEFGVLLTAYVLVGREVLWIALQNLRRGKFFDENFLMSVATLGAIAIHELPEAVGVMLFYSVGELFQDVAVNRSRGSIKALLEIRPDYANVKRDGEIVQVDPDAVSVGDQILVKPGEKIPLDGEIVEGTSFVDTSALTGESVPREVGVGDEVLAGMINTQGMITLTVSKPFKESSAAKILQLVEHAAARKAPTEAFITTFSRYYTPVVVFLAVGIAVIPPLAIPGASFSDWVYRALVILVISCPCALVLSIPLGYFGGIGGASRQGILVKGANFLDALTRVRTVGMDKTGTLTKGVFKVTEVTPYNGFSKDEVLELAAHAESHSSHPIATSIQEAYGKPVDESRVEHYEEISGHGIKATIDGRIVLAGNDRLLHREEIPHDDCSAEGTVVFVASDRVLMGRMIIADEIKPDAQEAVRALKRLGVSRLVMLTGDDSQVAQRVAQSLGIDEYHGELLPEDKVMWIEKLVGSEDGSKETVVFAGDGINDAPVLTRADVGIAMGGLGSDAAIETADVVIMDDAPSKIAGAIGVARKTRRIVLQNIGFALAVKIVFVSFGAFGLATIWQAVFADVGVSLIAVLNATRALRS